MWVYFSFVFDLFQFPFWQQETLLDVLCPCPPEGQPLGHVLSAYSVWLIVKSFRHKNSLQYKSSISKYDFFLHICWFGKVINIMSDGLKLHTVQNLHCDNDSWILSLKLRPFQNLFNPHWKLSALLNNSCFYFLCSDSYDFCSLFHFLDSGFLKGILSGPFIIQQLSSK